MQIEVSVDIAGTSRAFMARLGPLVSQAVRQSAAEVEARAKIAIQIGPKSGRVYKRGRRIHQASAPGEAPATDTGNLVNSIQARPRGQFTAEVAAGAEYAEKLELGGARVAPRPFLSPALEAERERFAARVHLAVAQAAGQGA
jgi:hypothetical protein